MFYAHFVLSKKGPLARIWLAAHWDKKLTKAHVFETNIDSSVEAIIKPKVKMALRTSGHLLLGVVRIYSRKAKYLLADCNEAFVKIKMAFRPGVVDLPEENREAAVAAITLPETFHDFDTTMADLNDIDVQAQFTVNQSRPEEITMREDLGNITLVGDDGFGDSIFEYEEDEDGFGGELDEEEIQIWIKGFVTNNKDNPINLEKICSMIDETLCRNCQKTRSLHGSPRKERTPSPQKGIIKDKISPLQDRERPRKPRLMHRNSSMMDSGIGLDSDTGICDLSDDESDDTEILKSSYCDDDDDDDIDVCNCDESATGSSAGRRQSEHSGDMGFDDREVLRDAHMDDTLYKNPESSSVLLDNTVDKDKSVEKPMDIDFTAPAGDNDFGEALGDNLYDDDDDDPGGVIDDDDSDDDNFGGDVDHELFGENFMDAGGLFEEPPVPEVPLADAEAAAPTTQAVEEKRKEPSLEETEAGPSTLEPSVVPDQTTLVPDEQEAFALEPLDVTSIGTERKSKRKRKLIVDEQKGIASETMKLQLSDTSDIVTTLDLAPPTKKLMHWKETGGVEKLFALPGRAIVSKTISKLFVKNLTTRPMTDIEEQEEDRLELEAPEIARESFAQRPPNPPQQPAATEEELLPPPPPPPPPAPLPVEATFVEEPSSRLEPPPEIEPPPPPPIPEPLPPQETSTADSTLRAEPEDSIMKPKTPGEPEPEDNDDIFMDNLDYDLPLETTEAAAQEEVEERRWNKRTQQLLHVLSKTYVHDETASFKELVAKNNRKQVAAKFYTFLVLKKQQAIEVEQTAPYGDILITKGPNYALVY